MSNVPYVAYKTNMDFSIGFLIYSGNFYFGVSALSVTQPDEGLEGVSKRPWTQIYQGGYKFQLKSKWNCNAYTFIKLQSYQQNFFSTALILVMVYLSYILVRE